MDKTLVRGGTARRAGRRKKAANSDSNAPSYTTYSIRLIDRDRASLEEALARKGWTATHFIREATIEKAAHIRNTSAPTSFDFDKLARRLALQLCDPKVLVGVASDPEGGLTSFDAFASSLPQLSADLFSTTDPAPLKLADVEEVRRAGRFGGTEFLLRLLDECDRLLVHQRTDLPAPVDPYEPVEDA